MQHKDTQSHTVQGVREQMGGQTKKRADKQHQTLGRLTKTENQYEGVKLEPL